MQSNKISGIISNFRDKSVSKIIKKVEPSQALGFTRLAMIGGFFVAGVLTLFPGGFLNDRFHVVSYDNSRVIYGKSDPSASVLGQVKGEKIDSDSGKVLGISEELFPVLKSENFQIKQVNFGGNVILADENNAVPLSVVNVRTEIVTDNKGKENKLLLYWRTNKLSVSEVVYFRSGEDEDTGRKIIDNDYAFSHSLILNNLERGMAYNFVIKARDRWGNEVKTGRFAAYSGTKPLSVFELIVRTLEETFNWKR